MHNTRQAEIKVGIVSFIATVLLVGGIFLGKSMHIGKSVMLKIKFPSSGNIQMTSPVLVNGVKRGLVKNIKNYEGSVYITAEMDHIDDLKADAHARISILELTGGKKVEIFPGTSEEKLNTLFIEGDTPPDMADLVAYAGGMVHKLGGLIYALDTTLQSVNALIGDDDFRNKLTNTLSYAELATRDMQSLLASNKGDITRALRNAEEISSSLKALLRDNEPKLNAMINKADMAINGINSMLDRSDVSINNLNQITSDLKSISGEIKNGNNTLSRLIYDKQLSNRIDTTILILNRLMLKIGKQGIDANVRIGFR